MTDSREHADDLAMQDLLGRFVDEPSLRRDPAGVVAGVTRRRAGRATPIRLWVPAIAAMAALALLVVSSAGLPSRTPDAASRANTVTVNGLTYRVSVGRGLDIEPSALSLYADNAQSTAASTVGTVVYRLSGVDPALVLAMPSAAGARDDAGPYPDFIILFRGKTLPVPAMCQYLASDAPATTLPGC